MENTINNSKLRALLSIRNYNAILESHYEQMNAIEDNLNALNNNTAKMLEVDCSVSTYEKWNEILKEQNNAIVSINLILSAINNKVRFENRSDSTELWNQFDFYITKLKNTFNTTEDFGFEILPENEIIHWKMDIDNLKDNFLSVLDAHATASKTELEIINNYTSKELFTLSRIVLENIPHDFILEEANQYEHEYFNAVEKFNQEKTRDKSLWDKVLNIISGETHQPTAERVVAQRWLEEGRNDE